MLITPHLIVGLVAVRDQHTLEGRKLGRGLDHFRKEGAKLAPPPTERDAFESEAYRLWQIKQQGK